MNINYSENLQRFKTLIEIGTKNYSGKENRNKKFIILVR